MNEGFFYTNWPILLGMIGIVILLFIGNILDTFFKNNKVWIGIKYTFITTFICGGFGLVLLMFFSLAHINDCHPYGN